MKTKDVVTFWSTIIISNIYIAVDKLLPGLIWLLLGILIMFVAIVSKIRKKNRLEEEN